MSNTGKQMYQDIVDTIHIYIININEEKERGSAQFLQRCSLSLFSGVLHLKKRKEKNRDLQ